MLKDRYGNLMSTTSQAAVAKFDQACELIRLYRGDPIAALDAVLEDDPDCAMAWAARAGILVQQADKAYAEEAERSIRAGAAANGNERERAHLEAARHWLEGRIHEATTAFARIAQEHPARSDRAAGRPSRLLLSRPPERAARLAGSGAARVQPRRRRLSRTCSAWRRSATRNAATTRAPMRSAARPLRSIRATAGRCTRWRMSTRCAAT